MLTTLIYVLILWGTIALAWLVAWWRGGVAWWTEAAGAVLKRCTT